MDIKETATVIASRQIETTPHQKKNGLLFDFQVDLSNGKTISVNKLHIVGEKFILIEFFNRPTWIAKSLLEGADVSSRHNTVV